MKNSKLGKGKGLEEASWVRVRGADKKEQVGRRKGRKRAGGSDGRGGKGLEGASWVRKRASWVRGKAQVGGGGSCMGEREEGEKQFGGSRRGARRKRAIWARGGEVGGGGERGEGKGGERQIQRKRCAHGGRGGEEEGERIGLETILFSTHQLPYPMTTNPTIAKSHDFMTTSADGYTRRHGHTQG